MRVADLTAFAADAFFVEDVGFGEEPQIRGGETESGRETAGRDEQRGAARRLGVLDRQRDQVVFLQQLDRPLGASAGGGDEQHGLVLVTRAAQLADPVGNASMKLTHRLTRDVHRASGRDRAVRDGDATALSSSPRRQDGIDDRRRRHRVFDRRRRWRHRCRLVPRARAARDAWPSESTGSRMSHDAISAAGSATTRSPRFTASA